MAFIPGTEGLAEKFAAKQAAAYSPESVAKAKALGAKKAVGLYEGKALQPGIHSHDGDFNMLRDKLIATQGLSPEAATAVAGKVKAAVAAKMAAKAHTGVR